MQKVPVLIFANKQDIEGALDPEEIMKLMELGEIQSRPWSINACSAITGMGVNEGMTWVMTEISKRQK